MQTDGVRNLREPPPVVSSADPEAFAPWPSSAIGRVRSALKFSPVEIAVLAVLGLLVLGGASLAWVRARPLPLAAAPESALVQPSETAGVQPASIWVHVAGAVLRPGVYELPADSRAVDAVRLAGGLGPHADALSVNLARLLADGEQLIVPRRVKQSASNAQGSSAPGSTQSSLVNVNSADQAELETLPGIGPALAQRIIEYREQNGPFASVKDLVNVSGIGDKTLANLEPYVTV